MMDKIQLDANTRFVRQNEELYDTNSLDIQVTVILKNYRAIENLSVHIQLAQKGIAEFFDEDIDLYSEQIHQSLTPVNSTTCDVTGKLSVNHPIETKYVYTADFKSESNGSSNFLDILKQLPSYMVDQEEDFDLIISCVLDPGTDVELPLTTTLNIENPFKEAQFIFQPKVTFTCFEFKLAVIEALYKKGYYQKEYASHQEKLSNLAALEERLAFFQKLSIPQAYLEEIDLLSIDKGMKIIGILSHPYGREGQGYYIDTLADLPLLTGLKEFYAASLPNVSDFTPLINHQGIRQTFCPTFPETVISELKEVGKLVKIPLLDSNINTEIFWLYVDQAGVEFNAKKYNLAINLYKKALDFGNNHQVLSRIAVCYNALGNSEMKLKYFLKSIEVKPTYSYALNDIAFHYYAEGNMELALKYINTATAQNDYPLAFATKAEIMFKMDDEKGLFQALEDSALRNIDLRILDKGIAAQYGHTFQYEFIKSLGSFITFNENENKVFDNTMLSRSHYYTGEILEEPSPHKLNYDVNNFYTPQLAPLVQHLLLPLAHLDLREFNEAYDVKIPIIYDENYQFSWMVSSLNDQGLIEYQAYYEFDKSYSIHTLETMKSLQHQDYVEMRSELSGEQAKYMHIFKHPTQGEPHSKDMSIDDSADWMIKNELNTKTSFGDVIKNLGPVPFYRQNNFNIPVSPLDIGEYLFCGRFDAYAAGFADVSYYLFYNHEERKVAQLMQRS